MISVQRISIRILLAMVSLIAMICASITYPSSAWAATILFTVVFLMLLSFLGIIYRRGSKQAFCVGFALFGISSSLANWKFSELVDATIANAISDQVIIVAPTLYRSQKELDDLIYRHASHRAVYKTPSQSILTRILAAESTVRLAHRIEIVSTVAVLISGIVGGWVGVYFRKTQAAEIAA